MGDVTIGFELASHYGAYPRMREQWIKAEELGAHRLYASDHMHAIPLETSVLEVPNDGKHTRTEQFNVFEATSIQAAMAATTSRALIGCAVHCTAYRNPNMLAFIAGTIDHISGGRFLLGIGAGYAKADFEEFGYEYGTQTTRSQRLDHDIPVIRARFDKLIPPPLHRIPIMVASMGDKIGLRTVAKYADIWHAFGPLELIQSKKETLKRHCDEVGRDFNEIEIAVNWMPDYIKGPEENPDNYLKLGATHIIAVAQGPDWDLGIFRELAAWQQSL